MDQGNRRRAQRSGDFGARTTPGLSCSSRKPTESGNVLTGRCQACILLSLMKMPRAEPLRRGASLARRKAFERRGDWSRSQPARDDVFNLLAGHVDFDGGLFIEAGAYDGFFQSNTYWLEAARGWTGLLVEPVPGLARRARRQRPRSTVVNCALVDDTYPESTVTLHHGGPMSIVAQGDGTREWARRAEGFGERVYDFTVPARTLSSVLEELQISDIDFFSLDVEGFEAMVLRGLNLERFAPRTLLVEVVGNGGDHRQEIVDVLGDRYRLAGETSVDALFVRT
jgi:FkbM family methyltransferase